MVEEFFGAQSEAVIRELLDRYVERDSDRVRAHALDLRTAGQVQEAIKVLEAALASDPQNHRIHLDLARACLEVNEFQRAEEVLSNLPGPTQMEPEALKISSALNLARVADGAEALETLEKRVTEDPGNCEARYQLSAVKTLEGDYEGAMEQLLEILRRDRNFRDDAGRKGLLDLFQILGSGPLVNQYRALMSSALH